MGVALALAPHVVQGGTATTVRRDINNHDRTPYGGNIELWAACFCGLMCATQAQVDTVRAGL